MFESQPHIDLTWPQTRQTNMLCAVSTITWGGPIWVSIVCPIKFILQTTIDCVANRSERLTNVNLLFISIENN